jgi:hypothetical protein
MVTEFHDISIRGRLAFGMACLERMVSVMKYDNELFHSTIFPAIWEFCSTEDFGDWEQQIREVDPACVLENTIETPLKKLYGTLPKELQSTISNVIETGTANIYGSTGSYSPLSLQPLMLVIQTMNSLDIKVPDIQSFKKSAFSEYHGWGKSQPREYYLN